MYTENHDQALTFIDKVIKIKTEVYGKNNYVMITSLSTKARILQNKKDFQSALQCLDEAILITQDKTFGGFHWELFNLKGITGDIYLEQ